LPNEASIIKGTIEHLMTTPTGLNAFDVHIVYNTPQDMPIETELIQMTNASWPAGRRLFVDRVSGSKSKAENLNYVIPRIDTEFVVIYDADHHPDADGLAMAIAHLNSSGVDCVQGSTYIREGSFLARCFVNAEFFSTYFLAFPMMQAVSGTGLFGGANGIWRTRSLQQLTFDKDALTEDIDYFTNSFVRCGFKFDFLPECASGELLPSSFSAFWKQRLRWAMGWDEVTLKYVGEFWRANVSRRQRFGLYYIFICRWFILFCVTIVVFVNEMHTFDMVVKKMLPYAGFLSVDVVTDDLAAPGCVLELQTLSAYLYTFFIVCAVSRSIVDGFRPQLLFGLVVYICAIPFYIMFTAVLGSVSLTRVLSGRTGTWVVTARSASTASNVPLLDSGMPQRRLQVSMGILIAVGLAGAIGIGASIGASVGIFMGRRTHHFDVHISNWLPFHTTISKTVTYFDGDVVAMCIIAGMALAVFALVIFVSVGRLVARQEPVRRLASKLSSASLNLLAGSSNSLSRLGGGGSSNSLSLLG
jgi:hypothetical protein